MNESRNDWLDEAVQREGEVLFSDHPPSRDLVLFAEAPAELSDANLRAVTDHLRVCDECADDLARLRAAEMEWNLPPGTARGQGLRERVLRFLAPRFLIPAASLAVAALAVWGPDADRSSMVPVGQPVVLRAEVERGVAAQVVADAAGRISLSFVLPEDGRGPVEHCDVLVLTAEDQTVAHFARAAAFDDYGTFVVNLDASALKPGSYELVATDRLGERRFAFDFGNFPN